MSSRGTNQRLLTYVDALREAAAQEMRRDPRVFIFGLDTDDHKAIQGSTSGLVEEFGPERVFGTPLSEDAMTGVAIGAAMAGMRPIHVHIRGTLGYLNAAAVRFLEQELMTAYVLVGHIGSTQVFRRTAHAGVGVSAQE